MDEESDLSNSDSLLYFAEYFGHKKFNTIWKMPSVLLADYLGSDLDGLDSWPEGEIVMYEPHQVGQILLYESAICLAVQTYFKIVGVELKTEQLSNAEFLTPAGKVPVLRCGSLFWTDYDRITSFLKERGKAKDSDLDDEKRADVRAYMALINTIFLNAELYVCWADDLTYTSVTSKRYGSVYPWPLNRVITWRKRRQVLDKLAVLGWKNKTLTKVLSDVEKNLAVFSDVLGENPWFFGENPTELDALVFGHLFTILTTTLPDNRLCDLVNNHSNLVGFCKRVESNYFEKTAK